MGFSSIDDLVSKMTVTGNTRKMVVQKSSNNASAMAAGYWAETFQWAGNPSAGTVTSGTPGTAFAYTDASAGAIQHGGNVTPATKHILNCMAFTPTTTMCPTVAILCDFLVCYPSLVVTGTPTALTLAGLPRYATGEGVQCLVSVVSALGATIPTVTFTYKDQGNNTSVSPAAHTASAVSMQLSNLFTTDGSPFMRLEAGDTGIRSLSSYTLTPNTTGTVSAFLVKPLATIPLLTLNTASERDYLYQLPSLPQIQDGACLGWILSCGGAMIAAAKLQTHIDVAWG